MTDSAESIQAVMAALTGDWDWTYVRSAAMENRKIIDDQRAVCPTTNVLGLQDLSLQHISNILWAYVSLLQMREPMTGAFLEELRLRLHGATFNAQQLSNLLWSLCIAEVTPPCLSQSGMHPEGSMQHIILVPLYTFSCVLKELCLRLRLHAASPDAQQLSNVL